jgi:hypothetical protein
MGDSKCVEDESVCVASERLVRVLLLLGGLCSWVMGAADNKRVKDEGESSCAKNFFKGFGPSLCGRTTYCV